MKKRKFSYDYPMPAVTVDTVLFAKKRGDYHVLLIKRKSPPFKDKWALPGGFAEANESLLQAALRELQEETGIKLKKLEQLKAYGDPGRDPRGWTVTVAHMAVISARNSNLTVKPGDDAAEAKWVPLAELSGIAFDHRKIIRDAAKMLL